MSEAWVEADVANWRSLLADAYTVVERPGDVVERVTLRPDVWALALVDLVLILDDEARLWGAKVTMVEDQVEPWLVVGANPPTPSALQQRWLSEAHSQLVKQGATVTRIQIEAVGEGGSFTLTGEWPE